MGEMKSKGGAQLLSPLTKVFYFIVGACIIQAPLSAQSDLSFPQLIVQF